MWWSGKIKNLPVPDHGKVCGNRTVETVHGWGSWIGEKWVPLDDKTRPHKQRYKHNPLNVRFKFARTLHFQNDDAVQEQRAAFVARLLEEDARRARPRRPWPRRTRRRGGPGGGVCVDGARRRRFPGLGGRLAR